VTDVMVELIILAGIILLVGGSYWLDARDQRTDVKYKKYREDGSKWVP
jgi:hypothetical protein